MLGEHSDVVDRFGSLPISHLERRRRSQPHWLIAGIDDETDLTHLTFRMSEIDAYMTFRSSTAKPTWSLSKIGSGRLMREAASLSPLDSDQSDKRQREQ